MKRYLDLIPISARVNRGRHSMSVLCIALAVCLVAAIFGMADMFVRSQILQAQIDGGNFHIGLRYITDEEAALVSKRAGVKAAARYGVLNYRGEDGYTLCGKSAILVGCDEAWVGEMLVHNVVEGRFPQSETEAMLTQSAKERLGAVIGTEITIDGPDGQPLHYTVSGFCRDAGKTMREDAYGVILTTEAFRAIYPARGGKTLEDYDSICYVLFDDPWNLRQEIADLKADYGFSAEQVFENVKLVGLYGQSGSTQMMQIYTVAGILFVLVLAAGSMMIAGSLNSSVAQRTAFFGLMRCVGATPKQVMRLVRWEALRWCWYAIPLGLAAGVVVIWILCAVLRILSPEYFAQMPAFGVSIPSILAGILVGLLTVLLAARAPAAKAARVSPLTAVSGNAGGFPPVRQAANTRLFRVETALGIHHAAASRKNLILIAGSFALSVILFLAFSVTVDFMHHALNALYPWTADLSIVSADRTRSVDSGLLDTLRAHPAVEAAYGRMFAYDVPSVGEGQPPKFDLITYEQHQFGWAAEYLLEGTLDAAAQEPGTALAVYEPETSLRIGDTVTLNLGGRVCALRIVGVLSKAPFGNANDTGMLICSEDTFRQLTGTSDYTVIDIQLTPRATDADVNAIRQLAGDAPIFSDERLQNRSDRGTYYCFCLFVYGFLVLIGLITLFNIINSIAMSVAARTRQYGAFRAIGLSDRQLKRMVVAEACTYTAVGSLTGAVLGVFCNKTLFEMMVTFAWGTAWAMPWTELGIILLVVVLAVMLAVRRPIRNIRKTTIVDTINAL